MTRTATQPFVPLAALLALAAFFALAALAGAETATTPSKGITPDSFSKACTQTNGEEQLILDAEGNLEMSVCSHDGKRSNWCNWVKKTCTTVLVVPTTDRTDRTGGAGATGGDDAVLDDEP